MSLPAPGGMKCGFSDLRSPLGGPCVPVGPAGHHGAMATRDDAQAILEQLAGPTAVLRDDQWTAIEALVVHRRRALVVQRTGWGKSAVYFIAAKLLREAGRGDHQFEQCRGLGADPREGALR